MHARHDGGPKPANRLIVRSERPILTGRSFDFVELSVDHPDGVRRTRPIVRHRGAACVLPILDGPDGPEVVMVRNDRVTIADFLLELPAGGIDEGEDPAHTARRELEEATGYRASSVEPLGEFLTTPGLTDELMHAYVARGLEFAGQRLEPYEVLTVHRVRVTDLLSMLDRGELRDAKTMLCLLLAERSGVLG